MNAPCYVAGGDHALYLKQEARYACICLCEHGNLCRDHGEESVRSPWPQRAPHHIRAALWRLSPGRRAHPLHEPRMQPQNAGGVLQTTFRPFSCKGFYLCPSCSRKRSILFADVSRLIYRIIDEFYAQAAGRPLHSGMVIAHQTLGDMLRWNPHFQAIVLEGGFDEGGTFSLEKIRYEPFKGRVLFHTTYSEELLCRVSDLGGHEIGNGCVGCTLCPGKLQSE